MISPSASRTPLTEPFCIRIFSTLTPQRTFPPAASNEALIASVRAPLPPRGLPTRLTCLVAYPRAAIPVPGVSGARPQTVGPTEMVGIIICQSVKYLLNISIALLRDHLRSLISPSPLLFNAVELKSREDGFVEAMSRASFATGKASFKYLL